MNVSPAIYGALAFISPRLRVQCGAPSATVFRLGLAIRPDKTLYVNGRDRHIRPKNDIYVEKMHFCESISAAKCSVLSGL
jgi:hypothetical protein